MAQGGGRSVAGSMSSSARRLMQRGTSEAASGRGLTCSNARAAFATNASTARRNWQPGRSISEGLGSALRPPPRSAAATTRNGVMPKAVDRLTRLGTSAVASSTGASRQATASRREAVPRGGAAAVVRSRARKRSLDDMRRSTVLQFMALGAGQGLGWYFPGQRQLEEETPRSEGHPVGDERCRPGARRPSVAGGRCVAVPLRVGAAADRAAA